MQIKTTTRYHLMPVKMAKIKKKKTHKQKVLVKMSGKGISHTLLMGM